MKQQVVYIDVDDTLVRSVGSKRIPMPTVIAQVRRLHHDGATLFLWSSGGAEYCRKTADELGISECFAGFLPKPTTYIDDQPVQEWRDCRHLYPMQAAEAQENRARKWIGVPIDKWTEWQRAFASPSEGVALTAPCPCCGAQGLRRFYGKPAPAPIPRPDYIGRGAGWQWCTFCRVYEHSSTLVPNWWVPIAGVAEYQLTAEPELLEAELMRLGMA